MLAYNAASIEEVFLRNEVAKCRCSLVIKEEEEEERFLCSISVHKVCKTELS